MKETDRKSNWGGLRFLFLRQRYQQKQAELQAQFQAELGKTGRDDAVTRTRLKLIYRKRGLNI